MNIGIDLGGSHVGVGLVSDEMELVQVDYIDFPKRDTRIELDEIRTIIRDSIAKLLKENNLDKDQIKKVGLSIPGVPREDRVERIVNLRLDEISVYDLLPYFKDKKISVHNDGKCSAMAEKTLGSLKSEKDCIYLCLGTGIGAGVFLDEKLLSSQRLPAFEVGHMIIKEEGITCRCGNRGCFEVYASMRKFKNDLCMFLDLKQDLSGERLKEIVTNLKDNVLVEQVVDTYLNDVTTGITNLVNLFAPETISIGGSFVFYQDILLEKLIEKVENATYLANNCAPKIKIAELGHNAGIIGAVLLAE